MIEKTRLSEEQLARNFADLHPPLDRDEAAIEASRCLFCYDAPCSRSCPAEIDVPRFIRQILHDDPAGAAGTILGANPFGGSCARACPTEVLCEGACVHRSLLEEPVKIARLQRYATDFAEARGLRFFEAARDTGAKVAVVGAGPAGLTCAVELRKLGHAVSVFEARSLPGGLVTLGLSAYKVSTEYALGELAAIRESGIELRLETEVDARRLKKLRESHDAVFLGVGLGATAALGVPGEEAEGVCEALDFIFRSHTGPLSECPVGREVVVIGGGNTAVDVATQAVRLGAERVTLAYRRTAAEMPAFAYEYELAKADGISFLWGVSPLAFEARDGRLSGVRLQRMRQSPGGRGGRLSPVKGGEFVLPCDMAVKALGQDPLCEFLENLAGLELDRGRVVVDPATGATGIPGLYAGGDCISGGAEIVNAVEEGKRAARGMDEYIKTKRRDTGKNDE